MKVLLVISRIIDKISEVVGKAAAWLVLVAVLISAANAISRYALGLASNAWLELQWYLYGAVFLMAAAYTLQQNEHVRIDFVSNMLTKRQRDWVDLFGHLVFLLPFTVLMFWLAVPWVARSIETGEVSQNSGGLILWPAKILVVLGFALLTAQAVSEVIKRIAVLRKDIDDPWEQDELPPQIREMESIMTGAHTGKRNDD